MKKMNRSVHHPMCPFVLNGGECDCHVGLLKEQDKRIAQLEAENERLREAIEWALLLTQTEKESEFHHNFKVGIPDVLENALKAGDDDETE